METTIDRKIQIACIKYAVYEGIYNKLKISK